MYGKVRFSTQKSILQKLQKNTYQATGICDPLAIQKVFIKRLVDQTQNEMNCAQNYMILSPDMPFEQNP